MRRVITGLIALFAVTCCTSSAYSGIVLQYKFTGNTALPTFVAAGVDGSSAAAGPNDAGFSIIDDHIVDEPDGANNESQAVSGGDFFLLTVAADPGSLLTFNKLDFDVEVEDDATGNNRVFIRSSADSFASNIFADSGNITQANLVYHFSVNIASLGTVGTSGITFRFYSFSNKAERFIFDNITYDGTVDNPVPEPASMAVWGGMSLIGVYAAKRRARRQKSGELTG